MTTRTADPPAHARAADDDAIRATAAGRIVLHTLWSRAGEFCVWGEDPGRPASSPPRRGRPPKIPRPRPHPSACDPDTLRDALAAAAGDEAAGHANETRLTLLLPSLDRYTPQSSPRLLRDDDAGRPTPERPELRPWTLPALALAPAAALDFLLAVQDAPPGVRPGASVPYFAEVAKAALERVARGRVVPTLERREDGFAAVWRADRTDARARELLAALDAAMPAVCRAEPSGDRPSRMPDAGEAPWHGEPGRAAAAVLDEALDALTDACVREALGPGGVLPPRRGRPPRTLPAAEAWIEALAGDPAVVRADASALEELVEPLEAWRAAAATSSALRTCFRLHPPPAPEEEEDAGDPPGADDPGGADVATPWHLELLLQATDDPSLLVPAERVWSERGRTLTVLRRKVDSPQETLLGDLGRALRLFPDLEPALRSRRPTGLELDAAGAHRFLREAAPLLEQAGFGVIVPSWWKKPAARLGVRLHARSPAGDGAGTGLLGLDGVCAYEWRVALGDETLSHDEFRDIARMKVPLVRVRGEWVELRRDEVDAALEYLERERADGEMSAVDALRVGLGVEPSPAGLPVTGFDAEGWLGELFAADRDGPGAAAGVPPVPAPHTFHGTLRPYQERGLAWLAYLDRFGLGACLADDMGLGKTIQLLALMLAERERAADGNGDGSHARDGATDPAGAANTDSAVGPTLLVCPMSVVGNWAREAERFAPSLRVHVHHGGERASGAEFLEAAAASDLVITTYALAARDADDLAAVDWWRVALDEAQNIKNPSAKRTRAIRRLPARRRVALTGTPVENRLSELWSILEFLNPGLLGPQRRFRKRFARPIERYRDERRAALLRRLTGPFILRRLKTDRKIIRDLPEKIEMKVFCNLTREQATLYQAVVDDMLEKIDASDGIDRRGLILATMMKLKQVCNHPAQLLKDGSDLDGRSGKVARLEEILEEVVGNGDRALVFTQFAEMGRMLRTHLQRRLGREALFLHGGTAKPARDAMVDRFQNDDDDAPVFLLSLKAGGTGLNLTAANHVIHFDRWWNPAVEDQATDRAFRIGQRRDVQVRKFVCGGTLEERIDAMIERKKELAEQVVGTGEGWLTEMSTAELRDVVALAADAVAE